MVLVTHARLSSMISPFLKNCDQAALPHQLHTDVYFSHVLFFTFLWWIVYFIFNFFPSMSIFCLSLSSAFHAYSRYEFMLSGNLLTVFSTMPSRSLMKAVDRPQSRRTPLDISFQTDAESAVSTLKGFVSTSTWVFLSEDCTGWERVVTAPRCAPLLLLPRFGREVAGATHFSLP